MKRLLMVAFHFPPMSASSGMQRTLCFARALLHAGWQPIVLTAHPRAYDQQDHAHLPELPEGLIVERAFALDTARHLALFKRYPAFLARPDRWSSWLLGAVPVGLRIVARYRPTAVWSTYPIATAHAIGARLAKLGRLPWIADFRDPMAQDGYPPDPITWRHFKRIEERAVREARHCVFVTHGARQMYRQRYAQTPDDRFIVIENGYDEEVFAAVERSLVSPEPLNPRAFTLLHSGVVYPSERDPSKLFEALGALRARGALAPGELRIRFRAATHDALLNELADRHGVQDFIEVAPPIPYRDALAEMLRADALLVLQASNCNDQVPAKLYEYFRARRPVLALTDPSGDTARTMREFGVDTVAALDSATAITEALPRFLAQVRSQSAPRANESAVMGASRQARAGRLLELLAAYGAT